MAGPQAPLRLQVTPMTNFLKSAPRSMATGMVLLLLVAPLLALVPTASAAVNGSIALQDLSSGAIPVPPGGTHKMIYGTGAVMLINVTDNDLVGPTIKVRVTSDSDPSGEEVIMQRQGVIAGKATYYGIVAVEGSRIADNKRVFVQHEDRISAVYIDNEDNVGNTVARQDFVIWNSTNDGAISLNSPSFFGTGAQAEVTVVDSDIWTPTMTAKVVSESDETGTTLTLTRVTQGRYTGILTFTSGASSAGTIKVTDHDNVTVSYKDRDREGNEEEPQAVGIWRRAYTGRVQFVTEKYDALVNETVTPPSAETFVYGVSDGTADDKSSAWLRVEDLDLAGIGSINVNVRSLHPSNVGVDPTGRNVALTETGPKTGEFIAPLGFLTDAPSTGNRLRVKDGARVEARYTDPADEAGQLVVISANVTWKQVRTGILDFKTTETGTTSATTYNPAYVTDGCGAGVHCHKNLGYLLLEDKDLDTSASPDSVTVQLTSKRDLVGVPVVLTETTSASGVFRGTFQFNFTHSANMQTTPAGTYPVIWALCGESITATYQDARAADGRPTTTTKSLTLAGTSSGCAKTTPAIASTADLNVKLLKSATDTTTPSTFDIPSTGTATVHIELRDKAFNRNAAAAETNNRTLIISSATSNPAEWDDPASYHNQLGNTGVRMNVTVTETGVNTGIFRGTFQLSRSTNTIDSVLKVGDQEQFCVQWLGQSAAAANLTIVRSCSTGVWGKPAADSIIQFRTKLHQGVTLTNSQAYDGLTTGYIFVRDRDVFADTTKNVDKVTVNIRSESDLTGINIDLTERYGHHTMAACTVTFGGGSGCANPVANSAQDDRGFFGTFQFTTGASDDSRDLLKVKHRDTVSAFYTDHKPASLGAPATVVAHVKWNEKNDATLTIDRDPPIYRAKQAASDPANFVEITVEDKDLDVDALLNTATVTVRNERNSGTTVSLKETAANSGVFKGKIQLCRTATCLAGPPASAIPMADGEVFTVQYDDAFNQAGETQKHEVEGLFLNTTSAYLTLDKRRYFTYTDQATITLEDRDLDTTTVKDEVSVFVFSDSDATGEYILLRETGGNTGVFQGGFGFEDMTGDLKAKVGNAAIMVKSDDNIYVYYLDRDVDGNPGTATPGFEPVANIAQARWSLEQNLAPTVDIDTTPVHNKSTRQLAINPGNQVDFKLTATDSDGTIASWRLEFGDNTASVSGTGNVPSAAVPHVFQNAGTYTVRFTATDDDDSSSNLTMIILVRVPDTDPPGPIGNLTIEEVKTTTAKLSWKSPENNNTAKDGKGPSGYVVRTAAGPITTESEWNAAAAVTAANLAFDPVLLAAAGGTQRVTVSGLPTGTTQTIALRATDTGALLGPIASVSVTTLSQDNTPPVGVPVVTSSHAQWATSPNVDVTFTWTAVTDPDSPVRYRMQFNTQQDYTVQGSEQSVLETTTTFKDVQDGTYYFHLAACSEGGCGGTVTYGPITIKRVVAPTVSAAQIEAANLQVDVTVQRDGKNNVITWTLPASPPAPIAGVQIWRSTSPYTLVATLDNASDEFKAKRYVDEGAAKNASYRVTLFYTLGGASFGKSNGDPTTIAGFDALNDARAPTSSGKDGLPGWFWPVIIGAALLVLLIIVGLVLLLRNKDEDMDEAAAAGGEAGFAWPEQGEEAWPQEEAAWPEESTAETAWPEESGEELPPYEDEPLSDGLPSPDEVHGGEDEHHLACPHCGVDFIAYGSKPLVTQCPSCGVKGVLR
jgi:hypothetical protein